MAEPEPDVDQRTRPVRYVTVPEDLFERMARAYYSRAAHLDAPPPPAAVAPAAEPGPGRTPDARPRATVVGKDSAEYARLVAAVESPDGVPPGARPTGRNAARADPKQHLRTGPAGVAPEVPEGPAGPPGVGPGAVERAP